MKGCQTPKILQTRNRLTKLLSYKYMLTLTKKKPLWKRLRGKTLVSRRRSHSPRKLLLDFETKWEFAWMDFKTTWEQWLLFFFFLFEQECLLSYACPHPSILWREKLFLEVDRLRIAFWGGLYWFSPISDLGEIQKIWADEILDVGLML